MPSCIKYSEYDEGLHDLVYGPFEGPCGVCDGVSPASVLIRFNGGSGVPSDSGIPVLLGDVSFSVFNETLGGAPAPGLVDSVEYLGPNLFLVRIGPGSGPASFQIRLGDRRYSNFNRVYAFAGRQAYVSDVSVGASVPELAHDPITLDTVEYVVGWNGGYWSGSSAAWAPPHPGQISGAFNPFAHALYEIHRVNALDGIGLEGLYAYVDSHLDEFRGYTLDMGLAVRFFMEGVPLVVDLDSLGMLEAPSAPLIRNLNPLGVNQGVWRCIMQKPPDGRGPLYKGTRSPDENFNPDPFNHGQDDFDCRSFSESACVFLRQQLASSCPGARVGLYTVPGHALNWVDLGGDPKPCCEGYFLYEPQNGKVYADRAAYCLEEGMYPCEGAQLDVGWSFDDDFYPLQPTEWAQNAAEVQRIAGIICSCVGEAPAGTTESSIKSRCEDGTISEWFVNNYNYGEGAKNGPGKSPNVSGMPQIFGCQPYSCTLQGCVEDASGTLTKYECENFCRERWDCVQGLGGSSCESVGYRVSTQFFGSEGECASVCLLSSSSSSFTPTPTPTPTAPVVTPTAPVVTPTAPVVTPTDPVVALGACCLNSGPPEGAIFISCLYTTKEACDGHGGKWSEGQCEFDAALGKYINCECVLDCPNSDLRPALDGWSNDCSCCPESEPNYCKFNNSCRGCDQGFVQRLSEELQVCYCECARENGECPPGTELNKEISSPNYCKCDPVGACCMDTGYVDLENPYLCVALTEIKCPEIANTLKYRSSYWQQTTCDQVVCFGSSSSSSVGCPDQINGVSFKIDQQTRKCMTVDFFCTSQ